MATIVKFTPYNTADVAVAGASMNALAIGAYAYGAEIDNSTLLYEMGAFTLALSSAVLSVAPAFLSVFWLPNIDGNYTAASGNPGTSSLVGTWSGPGGSVQFMQVPLLNITLKGKVVIQNNLGVALPATTTSVCSLRRFADQAV